MMKYFIILLIVAIGAEAKDQFIYPLLETSNIQDYAKKISTKRNKFEILRRIDRFRNDSPSIKKIITEKPHQQVIESVSVFDGPQISTVAISEDEVTPFYSNFFTEKNFIKSRIESNWKDRAFQRVLQFRHQNESGNSQIGGL